MFVFVCALKCTFLGPFCFLDLLIISWFLSIFTFHFVTYFIKIKIKWNRFAKTWLIFNWVFFKTSLWLNLYFYCKFLLEFEGFEKSESNFVFFFTKLIWYLASMLISQRKWHFTFTVLHERRKNWTQMKIKNVSGNLFHFRSQ